MADTPKTYIDYLEQLAVRDVSTLQLKDREYGGSWKVRGGVGAFMMMARKWDRLENALGPQSNDPLSARISDKVTPFDVFGAIQHDSRDEGILDDIRDLRRYLLLVEAEMVARGVIL